jgi:hypothetical protein
MKNMKDNSINKLDNIDKKIEYIQFFYGKIWETDLQSQIEFIEFLNNNLIKAPLFIATINSLKELQSIKRKNKIC